MRLVHQPVVVTLNNTSIGTRMRIKTGTIKRKKNICTVATHVVMYIDQKEENN